ncbi:MAG: ADP/ATP-dependent (S)-NAD(P)H-hydrate dehydratase, partial [Pseudomonadota bacterium]
LTCWDQPEALFEIIDGRAAILTPHAGEFRHLFPDTDPETETFEARGKAVQRAAARSGAVVLLKGPDTIISTPDGEIAHLSSRGPDAVPWLATAGTGDVLAGLIAGLCARSFPLFEAACTGAWIHAAAARHLGPGMIAEDLPEAIPAVLKAVANGS